MPRLLKAINQTYPMTVKRRDNGDLEIIRWGLGTNGFRLVLLVLVLSMHPLGRGFLNTFGFKFPDEQKIIVTAEQASQLTLKVDKLTDELTRMQTDMKDVRTSVSGLQATVSGFQGNFDRNKPTQPQ